MEEISLDLRSFKNPNLGNAADPKDMAQHVVQCPRQTCLFPAIYLAPPFLQGSAAIPILKSACNRLDRPNKTRERGRSDSAILKAFIPLVRRIDPSLPGGFKFVGQITGLILWTHFPEVGGLQSPLIAQYLNFKVQR